MNRVLDKINKFFWAAGVLCFGFFLPLCFFVLGGAVAGLAKNLADYDLFSGGDGSALAVNSGLMTSAVSPAPFFAPFVSEVKKDIEPPESFKPEIAADPVCFRSVGIFLYAGTPLLFFHGATYFSGACDGGGYG